MIYYGKLPFSEERILIIPELVAIFIKGSYTKGMTDDESKILENLLIKMMQPTIKT